MNWNEYNLVLKCINELTHLIKNDNRDDKKKFFSDLPMLLLKAKTCMEQLQNKLIKLEGKNLALHANNYMSNDDVSEFHIKTKNIVGNFSSIGAKAILKYRNELVSFKKLVSEVSEHVDLTYNSLKKEVGRLPKIQISNNNINNKSEDLINQYTHAKYLVDDLVKDSGLITATLDKLVNQQSKVEDLEVRYRKSLSNININEAEFDSKRSQLDTSIIIATEFMERNKDVSKKIDDLQTETSELINNVRRLHHFTTSHKKNYEANNEELISLIDETKKVLGNASALKLGEHFNEQYLASKQMLFRWPLMSGMFLLCAISICLLSVFPELYIKVFGGNLAEHTANNNISFLVSRLLIAPLFLAGSWFCASQYIKQKNINEDYAYKKVLSFSLLSIKAEIETTGEENTSEFIKAIQKEIIKSPLESLDRKHYKNEMQLLRTVQSEAIKNIISKTNKIKKSNKNKVINDDKDNSKSS